MLSQNHLTGAEVYAVTLAHHQLEQGHQVYQMSNGFYFPSRAINYQIEVETKSKVTFIKNVLWLRNFIRKQNIQVVHSHSRAAAKVAYWALLNSETAHISTVHGVQHTSFSKKLFNQYGEFIVAVCENIKNQLIADFSYREQRIKVIPNPISPTDFYYLKNETQSHNIKKIAIVGRTTGPKKNRTEQVIQALAPMGFEVSLLGGYLKDLDIDPKVKNKIKEVHTVGLTSEIYSEYDLVIGSGRVCMESLITGIPTIAFGESQYIGLITCNNFNEALKSNFGDIHQDAKEPQINLHRFSDDLNAVKANSLELSQLAMHKFSLDTIAGKVLRIYESAYFLKNYSSWIPILMYHKIPDTKISSQHKIFVTKDNFEKHLRYFKSRGFETLTFSDLMKFRKGIKKFKEFPKKPLILTFDDGYSDNLINASPLLKKYNFKAQIFLLADPGINKNSWDMATDEPESSIVSGPDRRKWKQSEFEIGSHGFTHQKITDYSYDAAFKEVIESKKTLEKEFEVSINVFAFTYGIRRADSADLTQKAGYDYAVNTDTGGLLIEEDPYSIFRVNIFPDENHWSLFKKTSTWYRKYYYIKRKK